MDLGNVLAELGGSYIQARYSSPMPTSPTPVFFGDALSKGYDYLTGDGGAAVPTVGARGMVWDPKANCGQGKWIRRGRRRRRRLATPTDIKDLSALKGVLGNGDAFKTWIATHSN